MAVGYETALDDLACPETITFLLLGLSNAALWTEIAIQSVPFARIGSVNGGDSEDVTV
mgnify:CR=1 FL=1